MGARLLGSAIEMLPPDPGPLALVEVGIGAPGGLCREEVIDDPVLEGLAVVFSGHGYGLASKKA
jgi:hypothetical protein